MSAVVRVGVHPSNLSLRVLSHRDVLERELGTDVEWVRYPVGPDTGRLIGEGCIDLGGTGSTPPVVAQAAGVPLVYVALSLPRPDIATLVTLRESPIRRVRDLKGKRVGLSYRSWHTQLIAVALDDAGISWRDIQPVDTGDGRDHPGLDAWVAEPHEIESRGLRVLLPTGDAISNPSVFQASREFAEKSPGLVGLYAKALDASDRWIGASPRAAAQLLADREGGDASRIEAGLRHRSWGIVPVSDDFLAEQQRAADIFASAGIIPRTVRVLDAAPPPAAADAVARSLGVLAG